MAALLWCSLVILVLVLILPFTLEQIPSFEIRLASRSENRITLVCEEIPPSQRDVDFFLNGSLLAQQEENTISIEITSDKEGHFSCGLYDPNTRIARQSSSIGPYAGKQIYIAQDMQMSSLVSFT